jgi:hypothetical protein
MMRHDLPEDRWHKSSYSLDNGGECVETQHTPQGHMAVRDTKDRDSGTLIFEATAWQDFITAVRDGTL